MEQAAVIAATNPAVAPSNVSEKSRLVALLFCILLGFLGVHRFYLGKIGTGILMALTLGGLGVWNLIDIILIAVGSFRDSEGKRVFRWVEAGSF
jgi:TM2 domain-containing membrane protein YozV